MKIYLKKGLLATSVAFIISVPAQAQTWTDGSGTPLALGLPITVSGSIIYSDAIIGPQTCDVSVDGTVTSSDTITLNGSTPGFVPNCTGLGTVVFPIVVKAEFSGSSFTGEIATANRIRLNKGILSCTASSVKFAWYDSPISEAQLHTGVTSGICTLNAGSRLQVTSTMAGNVDIR